jgi:O-antigen ligase
VLVNSRGAMLGVAVGIAIYASAIFFRSNKSFSFKMKVVAGLLACGVLFLSLTDATFWDRQKTMTQGNEDGNNADYGRLELWQYGVKLAVDHPLGVGGWGYTFLSGSFLPKELMGLSKMKAIHSTYLETLTAYGFIGLLCFLLFIYTGFKELSKANMDADGQQDHYLRLQRFALIGCFAGYLVSAIFIDRVYCEVTYYFPVIFSIYRSLYARAPTAAHNPVKPTLHNPVYPARRSTHAAKLP